MVFSLNPNPELKRTNYYNTQLNLNLKTPIITKLLQPMQLKTNVLIVIAMLVMSFTAFSQAPNLLNYQGVARNTVGNPLPNQTMKLRLSIHDLLPSGVVVYSEIRQITTNLGGLFSVQIGSAGASSSNGTIAGVNWIVGNKFLQVELDPASNNNYLDIGTVQLVSVPYAFGAGTAATVKTNANLTGVVTSSGNQTSIANGAITSDMIGTLNKSKVGLDLVNNTSDAAKPISTLTQAALGNKLNIADSTSGYVTPTQLAANKFDSTSISNRINLKANTSSLATVATSGSFNDLIYKPTIPAEYSLPTASASTLGGIKVGNNLSIDGDGVLTAGSGVPYSGATSAVDLGAFDLKVNGLTVGRGGGNISTNTAVGNAALSSNTTGSYNVANGYNSLKTSTTGSSNTANGSYSLYSNTTGDGNTANGYFSLYSNTTGYQNTANGYESLKSNTTGGGNTANGFMTLQANTEGHGNTANGYVSLQANTTGWANTTNGSYTLLSNLTGYQNTTIGYNSMRSNTTGNSNTGSGFGSLQFNTTGNSNTGIGFGSLNSNTEGSYNTSLGYAAGTTNTTGNQNTLIGYSADVSSNNLSNATAIGNGASVTASNTIQLGNTSITNVKTSGTLTAGAVTYPKVDGSNGQVLTTNGAGVPTWATPSGGGTHTIGESYGGGKVFYVTTDGLHGLIAETQDQSISCDRKDAQDVFSTSANHSAEGKLFTDWRLPTKNELNLLYSQKSLVGVFANSVYWSSTEDKNNTNNFWQQDFSTGSQLSTSSNGTNAYVRAIRSF
jgi:hypothetical protein